MSWKFSKFLDVFKLFFFVFLGCSAEEKHHVWLGCRVIEVCVYVYVCKFGSTKKYSGSKNIPDKK
jgi:hypothetical protein